MAVQKVHGVLDLHSEAGSAGAISRWWARNVRSQGTDVHRFLILLLGADNTLVQALEEDEYITNGFLNFLHRCFFPILKT